VWVPDVSSHPYSDYGARYNLATNMWTPTVEGRPSRRKSLHLDRTEMVVTGSIPGITARDGIPDARFDCRAPSLEAGHFNVWTGGEVIVWVDVLRRM